MGYTIKTIDGELREYAFDFGGVIALRNFTARTNGNRLIIQSAENANFTILDALVNEVEIDGVVYDDVTSAQEALQNLVFNPNPPVILKHSEYQELLDKIQQCCDNNTTFYTLEYIAGEGGSIEGFTTQTIQKGLNGSPVTAIPNSGYEFSEWSDGNTEANRTDVMVQEDITVTALFTGEGGYVFAADQNSVTLTCSGGTKNIAVTSTKEGALQSYETTSVPDWCSVSKTATGITITVGQN